MLVIRFGRQLVASGVALRRHVECVLVPSAPWAMVLGACGRCGCRPWRGARPAASCQASGHTQHGLLTKMLRSMQLFERCRRVGQSGFPRVVQARIGRAVCPDAAVDNPEPGRARSFSELILSQRRSRRHQENSQRSDTTRAPESGDHRECLRRWASDPSPVLAVFHTGIRASGCAGAARLQHQRSA